MSSPWSSDDSTKGGFRSRDIDVEEKALHIDTRMLPRTPALAHVESKASLQHIETIQSPISPVHEGITPFSSVPVLSLSWPAGYRAPDVPKQAAKKLSKPKPKTSKWILFQLWFNTYRKFFTFIVSLNLTGIILAACGKFPYAENHLGAMILGNLLMAILMRNELFLRVVYTICIYGLRGVSHSFQRIS